MLLKSTKQLAYDNPTPKLLIKHFLVLIIFSVIKRGIEQDPVLPKPSITIEVAGKCEL